MNSPTTQLRSAVVFGGSGFIGTHLVRELADSGVRVVVADVNPPYGLPPGVEFVYCDVREIIAAPTERFDAAFNLAAIHRTPGHESHEYYTTNVGGAINIVRWLEATATQYLSFTSSISVYGPSESLKTELSTPQPNSDYGRSKLLAEEIFRDWAHRAGSRRLTVSRPAVVFGPGEGGNFTRLARALRRRTFIYPGRDDVVKSCGYVDDLIAALLFAAARDEQTHLFNFCYPDRPTIAQICSAFHDVAGYPLPRMLPSHLVGAATRSLKVMNPRDRGSVSAARVAKLQVSTNIAADELKEMNFTWPTTLESAIARWFAVSGGRFI